MPPRLPAATSSRIPTRSSRQPPRKFLCECHHPSPVLSWSRRSLTISTRRRSPGTEYDHSTGRPRWAQTPARMTAPVSLKRHDPNNAYAVNESQERLDAFYTDFLGEGGDRLLTDEVKWLAVTHKSFDQGRRGYNDRLAFLGKRIVNLQTSLGLLHRTDGTMADPPDRHGREPFRHPVIDLLPRLTERGRLEIANTRRMANLASQNGMLGVLRWKPRKAEDLTGSGYEQVMAQAVYAIVGAVALQRGGEVVNRIAKDRILAPLGLR